MIEGQVDGYQKIRKTDNPFFDDLRNRRKYWELKEEAEDRKRSYISIFHKSLDLLISSILNNNNSNNNNNK